MPEVPGVYKVSLQLPGFDPVEQTVTVVEPGIYLEGPWLDGSFQERQKILKGCDGLTRLFRLAFIGVEPQKIMWEVNNGTLKNAENDYLRFSPISWEGGFRGIIENNSIPELTLYDCYMT